jgi:hypothetical protein
MKHRNKHGGLNLFLFLFWLFELTARKADIVGQIWKFAFALLLPGFFSWGPIILSEPCLKHVSVVFNLFRCSLFSYKL